MNKILKSVSIRIGLDDTDHPEIGCTTEKFDNLIKESLSSAKTIAMIGVSSVKNENMYVTLFFILWFFVFFFRNVVFLFCKKL